MIAEDTEIRPPGGWREPESTRKLPPLRWKPSGIATTISRLVASDIITAIQAGTPAAMIRGEAVAAILAEAVTLATEEETEVAEEVVTKPICRYGLMVMSTTPIFPFFTSVWTSNLAEPRLKFPPAT